MDRLTALCEVEIEIKDKLRKASAIQAKSVTIHPLGFYLFQVILKTGANWRFFFTWTYLRHHSAPAGPTAVNLGCIFITGAEALWTAPMYEIDCANKITATPSLTEGLTRYLFEQRCIRPHVNTLTSSFRRFLIREEKQHLATRREGVVNRIYF